MNAIVKTTPADGRFLADELYIKGYVDDARKIRSLADQVEAITKERDELQKQVDDFCMNYRMKTDVENKKLTQERDALVADVARLAARQKSFEKGATDAGIYLKAERDKLKAAAKLALDALESIPQTDSDCDVQTQREDDAVQEAITSLRQAGVQ